MKWQYKETNSFEQRLKMSSILKKNYPDLLPVIVEKFENASIPDIEKRRFLAPKDISVGQFIWIVRHRIKLEPEKAMFLFINKMVPSSTAKFREIYEEHQDEDGFLYVAYSGESTFGTSPAAADTVAVSLWDSATRVIPAYALFS